jgi:hypothetical protein
MLHFSQPWSGEQDQCCIPFQALPEISSPLHPLVPTKVSINSFQWCILPPIFFAYSPHYRAAWTGLSKWRLLSEFGPLHQVHLWLCLWDQHPDILKFQISKTIW